MKVGIDSLAYFIPKIHLPIETLAKARNIEPLKLTKGLGLQKMALLDTFQDVVTMAANAAHNLLKDNPNILPKEIAKIYVGTESGIDNSKPIASYTLGLLEQVYGQGTFRNCDAVDHTFACIGAVDAMQNAIDFIKANPTKKAIVIATDYAKYDLASTGEYTQGAGAIALLISTNPRMIAFSSQTGVATESVFDFFKPYRTLEKKLITGKDTNQVWHGIEEGEITLHKDQPVFEGQYSNQCYINRITEAYTHFKELNNRQSEKVYQHWKAILMHLPYCYQGRRTFHEIVLLENPDLIDITAEDAKDQIKAFAKSEKYMELVKDKIAPSEIASGNVGNIYTGSIFLGLLSTLTHFAETSENIENSKLGFVAYGSGSKSKVFEGEVQSEWLQGMPSKSIFTAIEESEAIDFDTYIALHKKERKSPLKQACNEFILDRIEQEIPHLIGARYYKFIQ
ncbi:MULTISPECIES: hydroxymethylglutaryl-CoA synthase family protein [Myroides]|uniref:Hydroxymethylglutaryl-CoA synthase n=1 Tax=Myroides albus TaxID=2562892 RepID=A0A6I3LNI5_9FLAO|nr:MULTISPECIES: hydroxymethylglutaryl-CoA synthase [Myroides]MTG99297.1 hydroxymethylglutaryl-CoA synthase [Myroides albus]MVX35690.1 hydroxymethylglutaryl-CoA synthase [Myroides sp. LoEW2-1]UVD80155.1 hydroxymethylglutaryl-CoA synthase family protein [Myroides albus]